MTEHEVKEWLKRGYNAYRETKLLETLLTASRMHAEGFDRSGEYNYTGRSNTRSNGTENAFMKLADIERKYKEHQQKLSDISGEIFRAVRSRLRHCMRCTVSGRQNAMSIKCQVLNSGVK